MTEDELLRLEHVYNRAMELRQNIQRLEEEREVFCSKLLHSDFHIAYDNGRMTNRITRLESINVATDLYGAIVDTFNKKLADAQQELKELTI